jgi:hypothetical protein
MSRDGKIHFSAPPTRSNDPVNGMSGSMSWHLSVARKVRYTAAQIPIAGASMVSRRQFLAGSAAGGLG